MSDIGRQLERLKSPNRNTRWDACEELRIAESLPPEAIKALELATEDEDAIVAVAAREALLAHRPPPSRSQEDAEIANQQERCPNCGRSWVTADWRYGNRLKRNAFVSRAARSFPVWVGAFVLIFLQFMGARDFNLKVFSVLALLGFTVMLVVVYRQVYGRSSAGRYPDARYTCRACGRQWTSEESRTVAARETDETEVTATPPPQEAKEDLTAAARETDEAEVTATRAPQIPKEYRRAETPADSQTKWRSLAISFGLALLINAVAILFVVGMTGQPVAPTLGYCLPAVALILGLGTRQESTSRFDSDRMNRIHRITKRSNPVHPVHPVKDRPGTRCRTGNSSFTSP
jgi:hypothetical protein